MSYVCVPVYDTMGRDAVTFIIQHSAARVMFVASEKMQHAMEALRHVTAPHLLLLVHWGPQPMGHMQPSPTPSVIADTAGDDIGAARVALGVTFRSSRGGGSDESSMASLPRHLSVSELLALGDVSGAALPVPPQPSDLTTLMYTSGTTGDPKGKLRTGAHG